MNALIVQILAVGLTLSQLFTKPPETFKPAFNPQTDQAQVEALLTDGCGFMMKEFAAEHIDFEHIFKLMMGNAEGQKNLSQEDQEDADELAQIGGSTGASTDAAPATPAPVTPAAPVDTQKTFTKKLMDKIDIPAMYSMYRQFCKGEKVENSTIKLDEVINFYNHALSDLPPVDKLVGYKLPSASTLRDQNDAVFTEFYAEDNRRHWISIKDLKPYVAQAFVAAEDKRFFQHNGLDIRGLIRAFAGNMGSEGRPQGGSTITQQVVKNLIVTNDLTFERKMKEMVLASRVEAVMSKDHAESKQLILELYINYVFLGRASWGIEMAAQSYFGKSAKRLSPAEAALLAGLTKGPGFYHTERHADRALARRGYVLGRMKEDGYITPDDYTKAMATPMQLIAYVPPRTKGGFYFIDEINRQVKALTQQIPGLPSLTGAPYEVYSTLNSELQKASDQALQDGLRKYEESIGRARFHGSEGSIADDIAKYNKSWQEVMPTVRPKLFDVQWPLGVVVALPGKTTVTQKGKKKTIYQTMQIGLADGRQMPLNGNAKYLAQLKKYDLVHVSVTEGKKPSADLRIPTTVQGGVVVLENKTGRVLSMSGGFSYAQSQLNRVTQTARQTGSTLKPFIYLAALNLGFQPNTLIPDQPVKFPPINKGGDFWSPKDYDGSAHGALVTIRQAIEHSLNLPTARITAAMGPPDNPGEGLDYVQGVTKELGIYKETERGYPFVLGAQPARLIDMAVAYATVANDGLRPTPYFIDKLATNDKVVWERPHYNLQPLQSVDRVSFYQLRRILEGTLVRGTAQRIKRWAGSVGGKTGTSNNQRDAWFVGFTNDITVAVWVGYDNDKIQAGLGDKFTGGRVALPIAEQIFEASIKMVKPMQPLPGPPDEIRDQVVESVAKGIAALGGLDVFRINKVLKFAQDTQNSVVTPEELASLPKLTEDGSVDDADNESSSLRPDEDLPSQEQQMSADDRYTPGVEDPQDMWRQQNRQVDPIFANPVFFNMKGE